MMKYKTLNEFSPKLYVINLDRRPDRYQEAVVEFQKINVIVDRVSGVDGKALLITRTGMNPGAFGLLLTHVELIKDAISKNYENIVIFEDDVKFVDNFNSIFNEKIEFLPNDWDFLYLGGNHILHVNGFNLVTGDKNFKVTKENYRTLNYELCKTPCTYCAHALVINSRIYNRILDTIQKNPSQPIDNIYYTIQMEGCNAYTFLPSLAIQRPSFSDIEGCRVDYGTMPQVNF